MLRFTRSRQHGLSDASSGAGIEVSLQPFRSAAVLDSLEERNTTCGRDARRVIRAPSCLHIICNAKPRHVLYAAHLSRSNYARFCVPKIRVARRLTRRITL